MYDKTLDVEIAELCKKLDKDYRRGLLSETDYCFQLCWHIASIIHSIFTPQEQDEMFWQWLSAYCPEYHGTGVF